MPQIPIKSPGRPLKATDAVIDAVCAFLETGDGIYKACEEADISHEAVRLRRHAEPAVDAKIEAAIKLGRLALDELAEATAKSKIRARYKMQSTIEKATEVITPEDYSKKATGADMNRVAGYNDAPLVDQSTTTINQQVNNNVVQFVEVQAQPEQTIDEIEALALEMRRKADGDSKAK